MSRAQRGCLALAAIGVVSVALIFWAVVDGWLSPYQSHPFSGTGVVTKPYLEPCLAIRVGVRDYFIDVWPDSLVVGDDDSTLVDGQGHIALRVGDRVSFTGTTGKAMGDKTCPTSEWNEVTSVDVVSPTPS